MDSGNKKEKKRGSFKKRIKRLFLLAIFFLLIKEVLVPVFLLSALSYYSATELNGRISALWAKIGYNGDIYFYRFKIKSKDEDRFLPFLKCREIKASLNYLALTRGKLKGVDLVAKEPEFLLHPARDESDWNFLSIFSRNPDKPQDTKAEGKHAKYFDWPFRSTRLENATLIIKVPQKNGWYDFKVTELNGTGIKYGGKVIFKDNILRGKFLGAPLIAKNFTLKFQRYVDFKAQVEIKYCELKKLVRNTPLDNDEIKGNVAAFISMQTEKDTGRRLIGSGFLDIDKARLWKLPLFVGILNILELTVPGEDVFDEAKIMFKIHQHKIEFDDMAFLSNALSFIGTGEMNMSGTEIDIKFVHRIGKTDFSTLPIFGGTIQGIFDFVKGNIIQVEAYGNFLAPEVKVVPFKGITKPINSVKRLFSSEEK